MKKQPKPTYKDFTFDSVGEMHFYWWCEELIDAGFINKVELQPKPFDLSEKVQLEYVKKLKKSKKILQKTILNPHEYTADVLINWNNCALNKFIFNISDEKYQEETDFDLIKANSFETYIELKPIFDQNNMTRLAVINQKWVMEKYNVFVNIITPEKLFDKTFTPKRYLLCDVSSKKRKINYKNVITLGEYLFK